MLVLWTGRSERYRRDVTIGPTFEVAKALGEIERRHGARRFPHLMEVPWIDGVLKPASFWEALVQEANAALALVKEPSPWLLETLKILATLPPDDGTAAQRIGMAKESPGPRKKAASAKGKTRKR